MKQDTPVQDPDESRLRDETVRGTVWAASSRFVTTFATFVFGIILARLLSPAEFGLFAMPMIILQFATALSDGGFSAALIQRRELDDADLTTIFWTVLGVGVLLTVSFFFAAPAVATLFDAPRLAGITRLLAVGFTVVALGNVHRAMLTRSMRFDWLSCLEAAACIFAGVLAIVMAAIGFGVWSLVAQHLAREAVKTSLLWNASRWRPRRFFSKQSLGRFWHYSSNLLGFSSFNYWVRHLDNLLIGKYLGENALGFYSRAYAIMLLPLQNLVGSIANVLFPAFSRIQDDTPRIASAYLQVSRCIALISFPMMIGLMIVSSEFVICVLGSRWAPMIPVLQILCPIGALQSIGALNGTIYKSVGEFRREPSIISIEKGDQLTRRQIDSSIPRHTRACIVVANVANPIHERLNLICRAVRRAVVNDDGLEIRIRLLQDAMHTRGNVFTFVVKWNDNGNARRIVQSSLVGHKTWGEINGTRPNAPEISHRGIHATLIRLTDPIGATRHRPRPDVCPAFDN